MEAMNPTVLKGTATALQLMGGMEKSAAYESMGGQRKEAAYAEAQQLEERAGESLAVSQLNAREQERQGRIASSRALAVAAASGGGASDPTVVNIMARLAGESHLRAMTSLYEGRGQARLLTRQAQMKRYGGEIAEFEAKKASQGEMFKVASTALEAFGPSLYDKYGKGSKPAKMEWYD